jgi:hypothetical protein
MADTDLLRELHDTYVWEVNAAVGENRMDLVWRLADDFADKALELMTAMESPGCERPDCLICARARGAGPVRRSRFGWARRRHTA